MEIIGKFLKLNWEKAIFLFAVSYFLWASIFWIVMGKNMLVHGIFHFLFTFPLIYALLMISNFCFRGITHFFMINKLVHDDRSPESIIELFDNGFILEVVDANRLFRFKLFSYRNNGLVFTKECLKGTISGFPVIVSFATETRYIWPYIDFGFTPLLKDGMAVEDEQNIRFNMTPFPFILSFLPRLKKDVKPDVLRFVADLKEKGYIRATE